MHSVQHFENKNRASPLTFLAHPPQTPRLILSSFSESLPVSWKLTRLSSTGDGISSSPVLRCQKKDQQSGGKANHFKLANFNRFQLTV